jgi:hypothetical protein
MQVLPLLGTQTRLRVEEIRRKLKERPSPTGALNKTLPALRVLLLYNINFAPRVLLLYIIIVALRVLLLYNIIVALRVLLWCRHYKQIAIILLLYNTGIARRVLLLYNINVYNFINRSSVDLYYKVTATKLNICLVLLLCVCVCVRACVRTCVCVCVGGIRQHCGV